MTTPTPPQNSRYSERSEEPYAKRSDLQESRTDDLFNDGLERLLAGDISGLDDIEPELRDTVLEITGLAHTAGWLTPSAGNAVSVDEGKHTESYHVAPPALHGHVPRRTTNRATGPQEVTMQATAIPATPPISHRTRERSKPAITPATRFPFPGIANAAVVVLLILAGFGSWRVFEGGMIGGGDGPVPAVRHHAQAPLATAEPGKAPLACDFSEEVPVYNGVDEPPVDGTVLYVTTSHELMLRCDEEPEDILLADNVDFVTATHWPGVINVGIGVGEVEPETVFLNVLTSERVTYSRGNSPMTQQGTMYATMRSPYFVSALPEDPGAWALTDLRSMETRSLDELGGVEWPRNSDVYVAENGAQGTYAFAAVNPSLTRGMGPALVQPQGFPGEIMLVSDTLDNVTWIDVPEDLTSPDSVHVSPDGKHITVVNRPGSESPGETTIVILDASDGTEVTRTNTLGLADSPGLLWVNDGEALVYVQPDALMMLEAAESSTAQTLLESNERLFDLKATHDPDVVTLSESGASISQWRGESDRVHAINTRTGSVETFEGRVWHPGTFTLPALRTQSIIILVDDEVNQNGSTRIIDSTTGKEILERPYMPIDGGGGSERFPSDSLALSIDLGTSAFTVREQETLVVADVRGANPEAREVPFPDFTPPEGEWSTQVDLSPNGMYLQFAVYNETTHKQWVMDLRDSGAAWQDVPEGTWMTYMPAVP